MINCLRTWVYLYNSNINSWGRERERWKNDDDDDWDDMDADVDAGNWTTRTSSENFDCNAKDWDSSRFGCHVFRFILRIWIHIECMVELWLIINTE